VEIEDPAALRRRRALDPAARHGRSGAGTAGCDQRRRRRRGSRRRLLAQGHRSRVGGSPRPARCCLSRVRRVPPRVGPVPEAEADRCHGGARIPPAPGRGAGARVSPRTAGCRGRAAPGGTSGDGACGEGLGLCRVPAGGRLRGRTRRFLSGEPSADVCPSAQRRRAVPGLHRGRRMGGFRSRPMAGHRRRRLRAPPRSQLVPEGPDPEQRSRGGRLRAAPLLVGGRVPPARVCAAHGDGGLFAGPASAPTKRMAGASRVAPTPRRGGTGGPGCPVDSSRRRPSPGSRRTPRTPARPGRRSSS
jgi:hypothetical protein